MEQNGILHMVLFTLRHEKGSAAEQAFLADGKRILSSIPQVRDFHVFRQVSAKSDFDYGFSMRFENEKAYRAYNGHGEHISFVENRWKPEVTAFQEIDFEEYGG